MMYEERTAAAPATIANVGPGFDVMGLALAGPSDVVTARRADHGGVRIVSIVSKGGGALGLPTDAAKNTAGIAAEHTRRAAGRADVGLDLLIEKGIPLASGMGGSAASAVAAAFAVNQLLGGPLRTAELIGPCVEAEAVVAGRHADNVAAALLGGLVLVRSDGPRPRVQRLPVPRGLVTVTVTPRAEVETKAARAALPREIPLSERSVNAANIAAFVAACYAGEVGLLEGCVADDVVERARLPLIPGGAAAVAAARGSGAVGATISGAGPTIFALCHARPVAEVVRDRMVEAFASAGIESMGLISPGDCPGAVLVEGDERAGEGES